MKHDWVRVYSPVNPIHKCRRCGLRRRTARGLGRRGGSWVAFRMPPREIYRILPGTPSCPPGPNSILADVNLLLKRLAPPAELEAAVMRPSQLLGSLRCRP
jgi:hypothetical protein